MPEQGSSGLLGAGLAGLALIAALLIPLILLMRSQKGDAAKKVRSRRVSRAGWVGEWLGKG